MLISFSLFRFVNYEISGNTVSLNVDKFFVDYNSSHRFFAYHQGCYFQRFFSLYFWFIQSKKCYSYANISYNCKTVNSHILKCKYYISRALLLQTYLRRLLDEIRWLCCIPFQKQPLKVVLENSSSEDSEKR